MYGELEQSISSDPNKLDDASTLDVLAAPKVAIAAEQALLF